MSIRIHFRLRCCLCPILWGWHMYRYVYAWCQFCVIFKNMISTHECICITKMILPKWHSCDRIWHCLIMYIFHNAHLDNSSMQPMFIMTSSKGNIFRITGALWGESTGHRWIPLTKASDADLRCFLWSEQTVEQTIETMLIWDAMVLIMTSV